MNEEEILSLNTYIEDLYQAMQIGDIKFEPKHSSELYNLINKLLKENQQLKDAINKAREDLKKHLNAKSYGNHKYELFDRKYLEDLLEMLKGSDE